jgi:prepilin-type N-terminal cleavage/methylation domain-containing protein
MRRSEGFTLIELMITITIMVILMTLAVVNMLSAQANGRDQERQTDIVTLARGLEVYYASGNPYTNTPKGYYPGGQEITAAAATSPPFSNFLEGVSTTSFEAPGLTATSSFGVDPNYASSAPGSNPDGSYSDTQARTLLASKPYLYQPLTRSNTFCASYTNCVRFNLYYLTEVDNTVHVIRSKNQ